MTRSAAVTTAKHTLHAALELSKNSWLLAIQFPDRDNPSLYPIRGGNAEGLMAKLDAASERLAQVSGQTPKVTPCYEEGYEGFWLAQMALARASIRVASGFRALRRPRGGWFSRLVAAPLAAGVLIAAVSGLGQ